ncbi:hypothetical protein N480_14155 [Pseudoalteromonas luteoviolacea S2607]|uniref:DUF6817 domain-containing protein n=1 Tax=Pseudoalteromonas luteoviolacea TaxID=43657 RepID=UPI0007B05381|nr:hypothetical protein [Pseudoalteromonas luteoviolacea]KZN37882.1 hypothetical protein N480_14155 [Pseudoalteromonas luteoviolacea S2607]
MEIRKENLEERVEQLQSLGSDIEHINGTLTKHLLGTYHLLKSWDLCEELCLAGLFHAVYGSDPTRSRLLGVEKRAEVANMIGSRAEMLVYMFCSCDKPKVLPQIGTQSPIMFIDRFTGEQSPFPEEFLNDFCELTIANDLDVARNKAVEQYHQDLLRMFKNMYPLVSEKTQAELDKLFVQFLS